MGLYMGFYEIYTGFNGDLIFERVERTCILASSGTNSDLTMDFLCIPSTNATFSSAMLKRGCIPTTKPNCILNKNLSCFRWRVSASPMQRKSWSAGPGAVLMHWKNRSWRNHRMGR